MIFACFGNAPVSQSFDRMAEAVDLLAATSSEDILVQSGHTQYVFRHARAVPFMSHDELINTMKSASMVILQGGWGSISEAIELGKRIVSIPRRVGQECNHPQEEVVRRLEAEGCLIGCYDTSMLPEIVVRARAFNFQPLKKGTAEPIINNFIAAL